MRRLRRVESFKGERQNQEFKRAKWERSMPLSKERKKEEKTARSQWKKEWLRLVFRGSTSKNQWGVANYGSGPAVLVGLLPHHSKQNDNESFEEEGGRQWSIDGPTKCEFGKPGLRRRSLTEMISSQHYAILSGTFSETVSEISRQRPLVPARFIIALPLIIGENPIWASWLLRKLRMAVPREFKSNHNHDHYTPSVLCFVRIMSWRMIWLSSSIWIA